VVRFSKRRAGESFICVAEVRITIFQGFASSDRAFDMLIKFREPCFQISLVKILRILLVYNAVGISL
jgi:hypothetical protein